MASTTSLSSGLLGAGTTQVYVGRGTLTAVSAVSDGTNVATVVVYDNAAGAASGTVLAKVNGSVTTGSNSVALTTPIRCDNGIVVVVSGSGTPQGIVYFGG